jgi:hypothetical protein
MPLPQQVIEQLGRGSVKTPGWSLGILFFSGSILCVMVAIYLGLTFGYEPYLNGSIAQAKSQMNVLGNSISSADQAKLIAYYSQVSNLNTLVSEHVFFSQFLTWLEGNTEANVYYGSLNFTSKNQVALTVFARTQADVNQQIAIFESSSDVIGVSVSNISFSAPAGMWTFALTLTLKPSLFLWQSAVASSSTAAALMAPQTSTAFTAAATSAPAASTTTSP